LENWLGPEDGYARILEHKRNEKGEGVFVLTNKCLDPSLISAPVIDLSHSTILMSGTLNPTEMFGHLLGFPSAPSMNASSQVSISSSSFNFFLPSLL